MAFGQDELAFRTRFNRQRSIQNGQFIDAATAGLEEHINRPSRHDYGRLILQKYDASNFSRHSVK